MTNKPIDKKAAREMEALVAAVRLHQSGDLTGAEAAYRKLIKGNPNNFNATGFFGALCLQRGEFEQALCFLDLSLGAKREQATVWGNKGAALKELHRPKEARACLQRALVLDPDYVDARFNLAWLDLMDGDFDAGWPAYELRWRTQQMAGAERRFGDIPLWLGQFPLSGRSILLHAEQGMGDALQFCRYAPLLVATGARVMLEVHSPLVSLLQTLPCEVQVLARGERLSGFDCHCPVMSLPLALRTRLETIPAAVPYLFADEVLRSEWRTRLGVRSRPRVGLVWAGNPAHVRDALRSIPLASLGDLLKMPVDFHCLQPDVRAADRDWLAGHGGVHLWCDALSDFAQSAALVAELDLVIAVDTAAVHMAGALGAEVWTLSPLSPDFRWLLDRDDSPWYPGMRLFRQERLGDWAGVLTRVTGALVERFGFA